MTSHFWETYRDIRSVIQKPDEAIGAITGRRVVYRAEAGDVFFAETDENGRERTFVNSPVLLFTGRQPGGLSLTAFACRKDGRSAATFSAFG
jgi:hypothetical protein